MLIEEGRSEAAVDDGAPVFLASGDRAVGEFHCADCGYGIAIRTVVPRCPMCGSEVWEPSRTSAVARERADLFG